MKITDNFKLTDKAEPPVKCGRRIFSASQSVTQNGAEVGNYSAEQEYIISHRAFTLGADEVFGIYPANGEAGDFGNTLPYITFNDRTLPWVFGENPFFALLVLKNDEIIGQGEIAVKDIFSPVQDTFFPPKSCFPNAYTEEETDCCRFIDISAQTYKEVFPSPSDIPLLTHVKLLDLSRASDEVCGKDGYFSVALANRFVPSAADAETSCACHLVTVFGHGDGIPAGFGRVRLISLYSWNIRSHSEMEKPFIALTKGLSKNCGAIGCGRLGGEAALKPHYTRTGEMTYSVYRSPLAGEEREEISQLSEARTADGRLIYDKETGVFDVSYAAAFQLGRLITLSQPQIAEKLIAGRNESKEELHRAALKTEALYVSENFDIGRLAELLAEYAESSKKLHS